MVKYFTNVNTIEELKKLYKKLAMQYHPDKGGNTAIFQDINNEYDYLYKVLQSGKTQQENNNINIDEFKEIINRIIFCNFEIEIIGKWIWVSGNTKPYKDILKQLGFKWASKKVMWYWRSEENICKSRNKLSIDEIRTKYGTNKINKSNYVLT